jgi:hypothetical protein
MDLTSTTIMLATCVFFLFGLTALTGSLPAAIFGRGNDDDLQNARPLAHSCRTAAHPKARS